MKTSKIYSDGERNSQERKIKELRLRFLEKVLRESYFFLREMGEERMSKEEKS